MNIHHFYKHPKIKQFNKLLGKHQIFQKMMYNNTIGAGGASDISKNAPAFVDKIWGNKC